MTRRMIGTSLGIAVAIGACAGIAGGLRAEPPEGDGEKTASTKQKDESEKAGKASVDLSEVPADTKAEQADLKKLPGEFKVYRTKHFSILHNVGDEAVKSFSTAIERTFKSDVNYAITMGIEPKTPKKKLIIYYFDKYELYRDYAKSLGLGEFPQTIPGVFVPLLNRSLFYDFRNMELLKKTKDEADAKVKDLQSQSKGKMSATERKKMNQAMAAAKANANRSGVRGGGITEATVQHEATHHVLWNIGFHNPKSFIANPRWFMEGTAMMFETVATAKASNIGAVNKDRLKDFQRLEEADRLHPVKEFITDPIFFHSGQQAMSTSYSEAWALAHYLNRTKKERIKVFVDELNKRPNDYESTPEKELATFEGAFGKVDEKWIRQWKAWMKKVR